MRLGLYLPYTTVSSKEFVTKLAFSNADLWLGLANCGGTERSGNLYPSAINSMIGEGACKTSLQKSMFSRSLPCTSDFCRALSSSSRHLPIVVDSMSGI